MQIVARTRADLAAARAAAPGRVGVVMTMGALHEGHAELVREARRTCDTVIVTIFLNPLQFGPAEDLARYPRTFDADLALCTREGVDLVFAPGPDVVYPDGDPGVRVSAGRLGEVLEGRSRPGHFDGVLTVVAKLLHLTRPDAAYFGQKDAQQLLIIRRMVRDLDFGVRDPRRPDGPGTGRPGDEQPQQVPHPAGPRGGADARPRRCGPARRPRPRGRAPSAGPRGPSSSPSPSCWSTTSFWSTRSRSRTCPSGTAARRCSRWPRASARPA